MLSKLMYHEFKATRRVFFPAYGIMLALAVISSVFMLLSGKLNQLMTPFFLLLTAYVLSLFAVGVLSFVYMIVRFYKNLLCDEGYLMFTLPATPAQLIWSKCIVSTIWMVISTILCVVTFMILMLPIMFGTYVQSDFALLQAIHMGFQQLIQSFGIHLVTIPILLIILGIVYIANSCMHIYACLAIGGLFNKHRLGAAVGAFIVCAIAWNIILSLLFSIGSKISNAFSWNLFSYSAFTHGMSSAYLSIIGWIVVVLLCMLVNFGITNYLFKRHLNLQ